MRCPDCGKFVSFEPGEPEADLEINSVSLDGGIVTIEIGGTVRGILNCAECGTELKEATFEVSQEHDFSLGEAIEKGKEWGTPDFEVEVNSCEPTDRQETIDKKGKVIPFRYRKTFYGISAKYTISGPDGFLSASFTFEDDLQASAWDELV